MNTLKEFCKQSFSFLSEQGYTLTSNSDYLVNFTKNSTKIEISFDTISYELTCQFENSENKIFTLQDILSYGEFSDLKGMYQLGNKSQLLQGVKYLAGVIKVAIKKYDVTNAGIFNELYEYRLKTRETLLNQYYLETDMKKAERLWKEKKYNETKQLYEKHKDNLSKTQNKRLEYLNNNTN